MSHYCLDSTVKLYPSPEWQMCRSSIKGSNVADGFKGQPYWVMGQMPNLRGPHHTNSGQHQLRSSYPDNASSIVSKERCQVCREIM